MQLLDLVRVKARLERERPWTALALADLDPKYAAASTWYGNPQGLDEIVLLYRGLDRPVVVPIGDAGDRMRALLDEVDAAIGPGVTFEVIVRPPLLSEVRCRYDIARQRHMLRMTLDPTRFRAAADHGGQRLTTTDHAEVAALYADGTASGEAPDAFAPSMLEHGVFYGIRDGATLSAVAGTHVVAPTVGVAVIGNVYTRRDRRGRGLSAAVTSLVAAHVLSTVGTPGTVGTLALNVRSDNAAAISVYERLGFERYCDFHETVVSARR